MWTLVFFLLFLGTLIALGVVLAAFTRKIAEVERQRAELEIEETRVFDFLHGLGEAFSEGVRSSDLHRLIVEGAVRILEAHGGALYLLDKSETVLVPAFVSPGCPPMVPLPKHLLDPGAAPSALESYLKLHSVKRGEGVIGRAWQTGQILVLGGDELEFGDGREGAHEVTSAMVGPLHYRRKTMGLLLVANGPMASPFDRDEIALFRTIAEQSAFALYNEAVYLEAGEKKRLDQDLQMAREIQKVLLPRRAPQIAGWDLDGLNLPARQVSGDYFDFISLGGGRWGIVIADVSGKGVPASLIMAMCRSVIRSQAQEASSPAELLRRVNRLVYPDIKEDMFVSMIFLVLEEGSPVIQFARAGHEHPLLYRTREERFEQLSSPGMALGIDSGQVFDRVAQDFSVCLQPEDVLVLYTDGTSEALDQEGLEFGLPRLEQTIVRQARDGASAVVRQTAQELTQFIGKQHQFDDITLIAIKKL
jgi:phosphoserine phosphatase RsbU/P